MFPWYELFWRSTNRETFILLLPSSTRRCKLTSLPLMNLKTRFDSAMDMHVSSMAACVCFSRKNPHNFYVKSVICCMRRTRQDVVMFLFIPNFSPPLCDIQHTTVAVFLLLLLSVLEFPILLPSSSTR